MLKSHLPDSAPIPLFYWSSVRFEGKAKENYGDLLSKYLVEKITGRKVRWVHPKRQPWHKWNKTNYLAAGSILPHATKDSIVWGSGIIDQNHDIAPADFRAVRGPRTRDFLLDLGHNCPPVYGDPALLLPLFYRPPVEKKYKLGIIPHYVDYEPVQKQYLSKEEIPVIDLLTDDIEGTTNEIAACEAIISSSLHGLIVAHAYGIPAAWVKFSDRIFGDDIKYRDYFESLDLESFPVESISGSLRTERLHEISRQFGRLPDRVNLVKIQQKLLVSCPFEQKNLIIIPNG